MSKHYYLRNKSLNALSLFSSKAKVIQVENEESGNILFLIPIIITLWTHMVEIYTMVSKMHGNVGLVLLVRKFVEVVGQII